MSSKKAFVFGMCAALLWTTIVYAVASYPTSVVSFPVRSDGQTITAAWFNSIHDEVTAIESGLINGLAHDLKFTDAAYDIGKSGATRPRHLYLSGNATVGGTLTVGGSAVASVPQNLIAFSDAGTCPTGWSEFTALRGRYVVGLPSGGTNTGTAGTALTNTENRAVGQHNHTGTVALSNGADGGAGAGGAAGTQSGGSTALTIANEGSVAGTNAPYIQLIACKKD